MGCLKACDVIVSEAIRVKLFRSQANVFSFRCFIMLHSGEGGGGGERLFACEGVSVSYLWNGLLGFFDRSP